MPELPEVETIARFLREGSSKSVAGLPGSSIETCQVLWPRVLANLAPEEFTRRIAGQAINSISRRGKFLVFSLSSDTLLFHLRMSGDMIVENALDEQGQPLPLRKHDRLVLNFADGRRLAFNDTRKFGRAWLTADPLEVLGNLGPEPLDPGLTAPIFHAMLSARNRQLKPLLMDQSFLAGLGNIYTDEALFLAKLHPLCQADQLTPEEAACLLDAIRSVLMEGIRHNGASIDWVYRGGEFQNHFRVYQRAGEACPECGTPIQRMVVGQRGTHFCPQCQPYK